jgi:cell wall-associated NlpC family hydrolase
MASAKCRMFCRALPSVILFGGLIAVGDAVPASAISPQQIAATYSQVAALENTIASEQEAGAALDAQYLTAQSRVQQLQSQLATTQRSLTQIKARIRTDKLHVGQDAISAYVYDEPTAQADTVFQGSPSKSLARDQYENAAIGNIDLAVQRLANQQGKLASTTSLETSEEQAAAQGADQVHQLEIANQQAAAALTATFNEVQGTLGQEVAQYAEQEAQTEAQLATTNPNAAPGAARSATQDASVAVALNGAAAMDAVIAANQAAAANGAPAVKGIAGALGLGAVAVAAAESQLGVPYVWGGETAGRGFDCSGLTQWAWRQAGVTIPRVAADQAAALPHVPLTQLQPGDLLFYYNLDGDNEIDHVVMYVGSGPYGPQTIIQAPYTGATVQFAPLFTEGLVAAGQP